MLEVEKEGGRLLLYRGRTALGKTGEAEARLETEASMVSRHVLANCSSQMTPKLVGKRPDAEMWEAKLP